MSILNQQIDLLGVSWYPKGSIIMWPSDDIPEGWLKCDGTAYSYTADGGKYKSLFDVIGTTFGTGTEGSTFKVPDMTNRFVEGASSTSGHTLGSYVEAGIPNHTHTFTGTSVNTGSKNNHKHTRGTMEIVGQVNGRSFGRGSVTASGALKSSYIGGNCSNSSWSGGNKNTYIVFDTNNATWTGELSYAGNHSHKFTAKGTIGNASANQATYGKSTTVQPKALMVNYIIRY